MQDFLKEITHKTYVTLLRPCLEKKKNMSKFCSYIRLQCHCKLNIILSLVQLKFLVGLNCPASIAIRFSRDRCSFKRVISGKWIEQGHYFVSLVKRCKFMRRMVCLLNKLPCCQQYPNLPHNFLIHLKPIQLLCTHLH